MASGKKNNQGETRVVGPFRRSTVEGVARIGFDVFTEVTTVGAAIRVTQKAIEGLEVLRALQEDLFGADSAASKEALAQEVTALGQKAGQGDTRAMTDLAVRYLNGLGLPKEPLFARDYLTAAAEAGNTTAQLYLAHYYERGIDPAIGEEEQLRRAVSWYRRAYDGGSGIAAHALGTLYMEGRGIEEGERENRYNTAADLFEEGLRRGVNQSKVGLAILLRGGHGRNSRRDRDSWERNKEDDRWAVELLQSAAADGSDEARNALADMVYYGWGVDGTEQENKRMALALLKEAAQNGDVRSQYDLAKKYMYDAGDKPTAEANDREAVRWLRAAVAQNYAPAQTDLGFMYLNRRVSDHGLRGTLRRAFGRFAPGAVHAAHHPDDVEAISCFRKAVAQGDIMAQLHLDWMYDNGLAQGYTQAVCWYRQAAEQGETYAQFKLGWMFANGQGVVHDDAQAVSWYRKAAEKEDVRSQIELGWMYENGRGTEKDDSQALLWYRKAAIWGNQDAQESLARIERRNAPILGAAEVNVDDPYADEGGWGEPYSVDSQKETWLPVPLQGVARKTEVKRSSWLRQLARKLSPF